MTEATLQQLIGIIAAISGVIVGSMATYIFNYRLKKIELTHAKEQELRIEKRSCCANFIAEASRLVIHGMHEKLTSPNEFVTLTAHFTNIELLCSNSTIQSALNIFNMALGLHGQRKLETKQTYAELRKELIISIKHEIDIKT